jgi:hypothetical protein
MHELYERVTNYLAYLISVVGLLFSSLTLEQWYFVSSMLLGLITILINIWHKRAMQQIAREQGIFRNEQTK